MADLAEALKFDPDWFGIRVQLVNPGFFETPLTAKNDFAMPCLIGAKEAAERMAEGFETSGFEITFQRRFTYILKLLRVLPYRLYFPIVGWITGR